MIESMTGYATKTITITAADGSQTHLTLMLKSLNGRFFEAHCKLPYAISHLETELTKLLKKKLKRGTIVFNIQVSNPGIFKGSVQAEPTIAKSYLDACAHLQKKFDIPGTITIADLLQFPAIFSVEEQPIDEQVKKQIIDAVNQLIDAVIAMRKEEGLSIEKDLYARIDSMQEAIEKIEVLQKNFMEQRKKEITEKLAYVDTSSEELAEAQRAALYFELDKIDINEEIVRFNNHLQTLKKAIQSPDLEKGRRIDFILQELHREANTIAAKCGKTEISSHAISIKVELEKAREQAQNIV